MSEIPRLSLKDLMRIRPQREIFRVEGKPSVSADVRRTEDGRIVKAENIQFAPPPLPFRQGL